MDIVDFLEFQNFLYYIDTFSYKFLIIKNTIIILKYIKE